MFCEVFFQNPFKASSSPPWMSSLMKSELTKFMLSSVIVFINISFFDFKSFRKGEELVNRIRLAYKRSFEDFYIDKFFFR